MSVVSLSEIGRIVDEIGKVTNSKISDLSINSALLVVSGIRSWADKTLKALQVVVPPKSESSESSRLRIGVERKDMIPVIEGLLRRKKKCDTQEMYMEIETVLGHRFTAADRMNENGRNLTKWQHAALGCVASMRRDGVIRPPSKRGAKGPMSLI